MEGKQTGAFFSKDHWCHPIHSFKAGNLCSALYFGPKQTKDPKWVQAVIAKRTVIRTIEVWTVPQGSIWRRHKTTISFNQG